MIDPSCEGAVVVPQGIACVECGEKEVEREALAFDGSNVLWAKESPPDSDIPF